MSDKLPIVVNEENSEINHESNSLRTPQDVAGYVEFFPSTVPCPSCRGSGRIPKGLEEQMVALIPLSDKRLRPRRTWLYVSIAVTICIAGAALMTYFLLPRDVVLENKIARYNPDLVNITGNDVVFISLTASYNFSNDNFFPVTISTLNVSVIYNFNEVGHALNKTVLIIPMRKTVTHLIQINITFTQVFGMTNYCNKTSTTGQILYLPFTASAQASYFGHTENPVLTSFHSLNCSPTKISNKVNSSSKYESSSQNAFKKLI